MTVEVDVNDGTKRIKLADLVVRDAIISDLVAMTRKDRCCPAAPALAEDRMLVVDSLLPSPTVLRSCGSVDGNARIVHNLDPPTASMAFHSGVRTASVTTSRACVCSELTCPTPLNHGFPWCSTG